MAISCFSKQLYAFPILFSDFEISGWSVLNKRFFISNESKWNFNDIPCFPIQPYAYPILFSWLDILWWSLLYIFLNISEDFEFSWFDSIIQKSLLSKKSQLTTLVDYIHRWIATFHLISRCCCCRCFYMHWRYKYAWAWGIEWNTCVWNKRNWIVRVLDWIYRGIWYVGCGCKTNWDCWWGMQISFFLNLFFTVSKWLK